MDRETFDRILKEEGIEDGNLIDDIWNTRPAGNLDENKLRQAAKKFKENLPGLLVTKALNAALDREYNRD